MGAKNGRQKGNAAEREVAKLIQGWWNQVEEGCEFVRTPLSGGWSTAGVREHFKAAGDLMTTSLLFPWTVEVKRREGWNLGTLTKGHRSPIWKWWRKAQEDAETEGEIPMLWLRKNRQPWRVIVPLIDKEFRPEVEQADCLWNYSDLQNRDVGRIPVMFLAETFLQSDPRKFKRI